MSDNNQKNSNSKAVPFFARYLEGQSIEDLSTEEMKNVKGGNLIEKTSSEKLEIIDVYHQGYDHNTGKTITLYNVPNSPGMAMTNKWPSDGDDEIPSWYLEQYGLQKP